MKRLDILALSILFLLLISAFSMPRSAPGDGLWLRLIGDENQSNDIAVHRFSALVWGWQQGDFAKAQVISALDLQGPDSTDAQSFKDSFDGLTAGQARSQALVIHWYLILAESGDLSRTQYNALVGTSIQ